MGCTDQERFVSEMKERREPRDLRFRRQYFPEAENAVFDTSEKGFVPVPILLRKLLRFLSAPELRILLYLQLRASRFGICYPTLEEISHELGLAGRKNITPHIHSLEKKKFIATRNVAGKNFYLIFDPRVVVEHLYRSAQLSAEELYEVNDLLADLGQEPIRVDVKEPHDGNETAVQ